MPPLAGAGLSEWFHVQWISFIVVCFERAYITSDIKF